MQTVTGELTELLRMPGSYYGNPRFKAFINGSYYQTAPDSMVAYALPNFVGKEVTIEWRYYYGNKTIEDIKAV